MRWSGARGAAQGLREALGLERDKQILRAQADLEARERDLPAPKPLEPLCVTHDWNPQPPMLGAPRPDRSECPQCKAEALGGDRSVEEARSIASPVVYDPTRAPNRLEEALDRHERKLEREHRPARGSFEELAARTLRRESPDVAFAVSQEAIERMALEHIDAKREQEREKDRQRSSRGRLAFSRIEGGVHVEYRAVKRRIGGRWREQLVRVTP